jgi:hypothetical protein
VACLFFNGKVGDHVKPIGLNIFTLVVFEVALPPAVTDITEYGQRSKGKIEDAGIECLGRLFTQLLDIFCADRTLGMGELTGK